MLINTELFDEITKVLKESNDNDGLALFDKWYRIDENQVPAKRMLLPISTFYPDFVGSSDSESSRSAAISWK
jgi:hypothetical protein